MEKGHENKFMSMNPLEFAALGGGQIAYIREVDENDAEAVSAGAPNPSAKVKLFALHGADGQPIMVSEDRDEIIANAFQINLMPLTVH